MMLSALFNAIWWCLLAIAFIGLLYAGVLAFQGNVAGTVIVVACDVALMRIIKPRGC
jgi:hypothetical protein